MPSLLTDTPTRSPSQWPLSPLGLACILSHSRACDWVSKLEPLSKMRPSEPQGGPGSPHIPTQLPTPQSG